MPIPWIPLKTCKEILDYLEGQLYQLNASRIFSILHRSVTMKNISIPTDLKNRLISNLGVTGDALEAALKDSQDPSGVTPFIAFVQQMADDFDADVKTKRLFDNVRVFLASLKSLLVKLMLP